MGPAFPPQLAPARPVNWYDPMDRAFPPPVRNMQAPPDPVLNEKVKDWIKNAREFLAEFPPVQVNQEVQMPTYSKAKSDFKNLEDESESVMMAGIHYREVEDLNERLVNRWKEYEVATKMPTGGRNRKRKTRKGKKRTTRRKKTSRR